MPTAKTSLESKNKYSKSAHTGAVLSSVLVLLGAIVIAVIANLEGLLAGGAFGGKASRDSVSVGANEALVIVAVFVASLFVLTSWRRTNFYTLALPAVVAIVSYILRVTMVGLNFVDLVNLLLVPFLAVAVANAAFSIGARTNLPKS